MATKKLIALFALTLGAAAGCAADAPAPGDDDGGGGGGGGGGDGTQSLDATGKYAVHSTYDLATNAPGKAGDVARAIIDATDEQTDPAKWIMEQAINALPSGIFKSALSNAKPFVAGFLNDRLLQIAPDFVTTMVQVGNDFGDVSKSFGLNETLDVAKSGSAYTATHTVLGAHFKINNVETDYDFAAFHTTNVVVTNVGVSVDQTGALQIADHKVPLQYGKVMRIALDGAIIPSLDPSAANLGTLFQHLVDCNAVGQAMNDAVVSLIGFGPGSGIFTTACNQGLVVGANFIYSKVDSIDGSALEFGIAGTAKVIDKNSDHKYDTIQTGKWAGTCSYAGNAAPLASATFFGSRM
jgi:hypothetical protein